MVLVSIRPQERQLPVGCGVLAYGAGRFKASAISSKRDVSRRMSLPHQTDEPMSKEQVSELRFINLCRDLGFLITNAIALRHFSTGSTDTRSTAEQCRRDREVKFR